MLWLLFQGNPNLDVFSVAADSWFCPNSAPASLTSFSLTGLSSAGLTLMCGVLCPPPSSFLPPQTLLVDAIHFSPTLATVPAPVSCFLLPSGDPLRLQHWALKQMCPHPILIHSYIISVPSRFYISVYGITILSMSQNRNFKYSFSFIP